MNSLMDCIDVIPSRLHDIYKNRTENLAELKKHLEDGFEIEHIVFVASGTSYNSAFTTKHFFETISGIKAELIYPNIFVNYTKMLDKKALYVFISQGGSTKLVYEGLIKAKKNGCLTCSITGDLHSPIAEKADIALAMGCGHEPYMYRTIGYSSTVGTLYLMAMELALANKKLTLAEYQEMGKDFLSAANNLKSIKDCTEAWYGNNKFSLLRRNELVITGTNDYWCVAQEADIKIMEMVPMFTRSFELEEFIHGPQNSFNDGMLFFVLSKAGEDEPKVKAVAQFLKKEIGFCCVVGQNPIDDRDLKLDIVSTYFAPLEMITVFQVLAFHMATDRGRDLKKGVNAQVSKYITKTL